MTESVARFVAAHAAATGTQSRDYADPFVSTQWAIVETATAIEQARHHVVALQCARIDKSIERMVNAQRELDRQLAQARQLSETIARVVKAHAERKKGTVAP